MISGASYLLVVLGTLLAALGSFFMKKGSSKLSLNIMQQIRNTNAILGIFLFLSSSVFYMFALKLEKLSIIYPMTSMTYVWVVFLSAFLLKEKFSYTRIAGVSLIILGIVLINLF
jgi:uncharacterized membrane protein